MEAFGTSPHGLGLQPLAFWLLTTREFEALCKPWRHSRGIPEPLTVEQQDNLARNQRYILDQQMRARNRQIAAKSKLGIVPKSIPLRQSNG